MNRFLAIPVLVAFCIVARADEASDEQILRQAKVDSNAAALLRFFRLRTLGFPICHALPHAFEFFRDEVRCAEPFFAVLAALGRTDLFRTHEVPRIRAVLETIKLATVEALKS